MVISMILNYLILTLLFLLPLQGRTASADHAKSPLYRDYRDPYPNFVIRPGNPDFDLYEIFSLTRRANAGDPIAQHDLGLCYLEGIGTVPDTVKAAYWVKRAAVQNHAVANFNMAVFYMNGWGVPWNPFEAYADIHFAAMAGMREAQYYLSRFLLENLVVPRDINQAYYWVKLSADSGYVPAQEVLSEFRKHGWVPTGEPDSSTVPGKEKKNKGRPKPAVEPVFLDFSHDTVAHPEYQTLVREAVEAQSPNRDKRLDSIIVENDTVRVDTAMSRSIRAAAERGSPEALLLIGEWHEEGRYVRKDAVMAASCYIRAMRLDSPRAPKMLYDLIQRDDFFTDLKHRIDKDDPAAEFVWPELVALGFDHSLTDEQARAMLGNSVRHQYIPGLIAAGNYAINGFWTKKDLKEAEDFWRAAQRMGNDEARLRILTARVLSGQEVIDPGVIAGLREDAANGSVLAQTLLGYCYEKGMGVSQNTLLASRFYREAAGRGSVAALEGLRRLYDALRPALKEFRVND